MKKPSKFTRLIRLSRSLKSSKREIRFLQRTLAEKEKLRASQKASYDTWKSNTDAEHERELGNAKSASAKEISKLSKITSDIEVIKLSFAKNQTNSIQGYTQVHEAAYALLKIVEKSSPEALQSEQSRLSRGYGNFIKKNPDVISKRLQ